MIRFKIREIVQNRTEPNYGSTISNTSMARHHVEFVVTELAHHADADQIRAYLLVNLPHCT